MMDFDSFCNLWSVASESLSARVSAVPLLVFVTLCAAITHYNNDGGISLSVVAAGSSNTVLHNRVFALPSTVARSSISSGSMSAVAKSDV